jgi:tetratricopeptide (TPR) repeat protein
LEQAHYDRALQLAARLRRVDHFGGYEIEALVHRAHDRLADALASLEQGLLKTPDNPVLLALLGLTHFHSGDPKAALQALEQAQKEGADADWIGYQQALVWQRLQRYPEALQACPRRPTNPEVRAPILEMRLRILLQLERLQELVEELEEAEEANSQAHWLGAQAFKALGRSEAARERVLLALQGDFSAGREMQALLEEVADPATLTCRRFAIRFHGKFRKPPKGMARARGGVAMAQVVAESQAEALSLYKKSEMTEIVRDFSLQRCEDRGPCPADQKGLFGAPRHIFY